MPETSSSSRAEIRRSQPSAKVAGTSVESRSRTGLLRFPCTSAPSNPYSSTSRSQFRRTDAVESMSVPARSKITASKSASNSGCAGLIGWRTPSIRSTRWACCGVVSAASTMMRGIRGSAAGSVGTRTLSRASPRNCRRRARISGRPTTLTTRMPNGAADATRSSHPAPPQLRSERSHEHGPHTQRARYRKSPPAAPRIAPSVLRHRGARRARATRKESAPGHRAAGS